MESVEVARAVSRTHDTQVSRSIVLPCFRAAITTKYGFPVIVPSIVAQVAQVAYRERPHVGLG